METPTPRKPNAYGTEVATGELLGGAERSTIFTCDTNMAPVPVGGDQG